MNKIKPYFEYNEFLESAGFKVELLDLDLNSSGWLRIHARWGCGDINYKVKYPKKESESSEFDCIGIDFCFPEFGKGKIFEDSDFESYLASFSVGIVLVNENDERLKDFTKFNFQYKFHENIKYGVNLYFAPDSFESGKDIPLSSYEGEEEKHFRFINENGELWTLCI